MRPPPTGSQTSKLIRQARAVAPSKPRHSARAQYGGGSKALAVQRIVITGANGSGKSHLATRLAALRPDLPLISYDALRLTTGWVKRPQSETERKLADVVAGAAWILEGGPSVLAHALPRAQAVLWLDPANAVRAWRLAVRPWRNLGRTRPELPAGNVDWPVSQYAFAWRSLRQSKRLRETVAAHLAAAPNTVLYPCRTATDVERALVSLHPAT